MRKRIWAWICIFFMLICCPKFTACAKENKAEDISINAKSAILVESTTGMILYEKNADEKLKPASVTKIMTLLLIFDEIKAGNINYEDIVTVSEHAASMGGSQCFFEAGEEQTVKDMIKCIEVASGNDAAVAMAEFVGGSESAFVNMMNEKAAELGMENTNFENACGLDSDNHYTSARDISIMTRELVVKHPEIYEYSNIWMDYIIHKTKRGEKRFDLVNTNKFINMYTGATGLKTGYTSTAKYCMSATAARNEINLIAVIMGADTKEIRNGEACRLLDYGFSKCALYKDDKVLDEELKISVKGAGQKSIKYKMPDQISFVADKSTIDKIEKSVNVYDDIAAPVKEGDCLGKIEYKVGDTCIYSMEIAAAEDVKPLTFFDRFVGILKNIFMLR